MSESTKYNGWANYQTWATALWWDNDPWAADMWRRKAVDAMDRNDHIKFKARGDLAEEIDEWLGGELESALELHGPVGLIHDLLTNAIDHIDSWELAEHYLADLPAAHAAHVVAYEAWQALEMIRTYRVSRMRNELA